LRKEVLEVLASQAAPGRTTQVGRLLEAGEVKAAIEKVTPSELFELASTMEPRQKGADGPLVAEIRQLRSEHPADVAEQAVSRAFGTPKPTLTNSYRPELLKLRTFPTLMGYSSRIMAESWESNTLFWVALADEVHATPSQLNVLIPEWTQRVVGVYSPRIWRTGRPCCVPCAWSATMCEPRPDFRRRRSRRPHCSKVSGE
jgi:hypothetical protein